MIKEKNIVQTFSHVHLKLNSDSTANATHSYHKSIRKFQSGNIHNWASSIKSLEPAINSVLLETSVPPSKIFAGRAGYLLLE
jgi:hypothetical protein